MTIQVKITYICIQSVRKLNLFYRFRQKNYRPTPDEFVVVRDLGKSGWIPSSRCRFSDPLYLKIQNNYGCRYFCNKLCKINNRYLCWIAIILVCKMYCAEMWVVGKMMTRMNWLVAESTTYSIRDLEVLLTADVGSYDL